MTSKQRLLSALRGQAVDKLPWSPNLAYWWENNGDEITKKGEFAFLKSIGADPLIRGHYPTRYKEWDHLFLYDITFTGGCGMREVINGKDKMIIYETPVGSIDFRYTHSDAGNTTYLVKHGVKTEEDFKILTYFKEHTKLEPKYDRFEEEAKAMGEEGLMIPLLSPDLKTGFQSMLEFWVGTEELVYALMDFPELVEEALAAMGKVTKRAAEICAASSAEAFITWEDSSTTNISPDLYGKYILPEINGWCDILHDADKLYIQHACGQLKALMPMIASSKIDCIESISPPPTGNIELWEARELLPKSIALIGGIEPTVFRYSSLEELEVYTRKLIQNMKGSRFILANSDSCPPYVELEKFNLVSEISKSYSW